MEIDDLRQEEVELLNRRVEASGNVDQFERLTDQLIEVRRKLFELEPRKAVERIPPNVWDALTKLRAELD